MIAVLFFMNFQYRKVVDSIAKMHLIGRAGEIEEFARCIMFLVSQAASFVTGINLPIDGGMVLTTRSPDEHSESK